jgi:hypothetical protein
VWCFLWGTGWICIYYFDELRLQGVKHHFMLTLGGGGIAPDIFNLCTRWGECLLHASATLPPMKEIKFPLVKSTLAGSQRTCGRCGEENKSYFVVNRVKVSGNYMYYFL